MNIFQQYKRYYKDNPEGLWFKRKLFGWGWMPVRWQGWVVILVYIGVLLALSLTIDENSSDREAMFTLLLPLAILTAMLIRICYKKGEKPKWMWGFPKKETPEKDEVSI